MIRARVETAGGKVLSGEIRGDLLVPADGDPVPLAGARFLAPVNPGKFIGLWNNYHAAAEKNGWPVPEHPLYFLKPPSSVSGPGAEVAVPAEAGRVIFEGELGIVIGRTCRNAGAAEAEAAILGFTCVNDLTSLDILNAVPGFPQWTRAKGFDGFGNIGPVIAAGLDWRQLVVRTLVNGRERQAYPVADMIFPPAEIVRRLSFDMTLEAGDVIAAGTSLGVRPVRAGDQVTVSIDGIGPLDVTLVGPAG